jgi:hypothetical protein
MPAGARTPVYAEYKEYIPPETSAASFWLKNRKPREWQDRKELSGPNGGPIPIASLTAQDFSDDELAAMIASESE